MDKKANNAKRPFGKMVDDWQWAWWDERIVLLDPRRSAAAVIHLANDGGWYWRVNSEKQIHQATNFFTAVEDALNQHKLLWPVHIDLRMIAAAEYERLRLLDEEFRKLVAQGETSNE